MEQLFCLNPKIYEKPIIIYGAGNTGLDLFVELMNRDVKITYFCDSNPSKWGIHLMNKEVISPERLKKIGNGYNIVIASIFFKEINVELEKMGINNAFCYKDIWRVEM